MTDTSAEQPHTPPDHVSTADPVGTPEVVVFDVNETLSDMSVLADRFTAVGAPDGLAGAWFSGLLRDGFALTVTGGNPSFADLARQSLGIQLAGLTPDVDAAVDHIMAGFGDLPLHEDVIEGVRALHDLGITLVTLSNGSTGVAQGLLERAGIDGLFTRLLSVQDATSWKPAAAAYTYGLQMCEVEASRAVLVAAHPWDIHGAHQAGLVGAWLNRTRATYPDYFASPDMEIGRLPELATRLAASARGAEGDSSARPATTA